MALKGTRIMVRTKCAILTAAFVAAVSSGGHAQSNNLQTELAHCLSFSGAVERLSCYDRLARGAARAVPQTSSALPPTPTAPPPARGDVTATRAVPQELGKEELRGARPPGEDRMTAVISDFREDPTGRFTITLSNGQVWQQIAGDTARAQYHSGGTKTVVIARGSFGSYDLAFSGRNITFKVKRLR
jgi:hypothetical protein